MSSATATPKRKRVVVKCTHHWDLGRPHGGIVHAVCRKCGAEQDYPSTHPWEEDNSSKPLHLH